MTEGAGEDHGAAAVWRWAQAGCVAAGAGVAATLGSGGSGNSTAEGCRWGGYHFPSDAIHQPGPWLTSAIAPPLSLDPDFGSIAHPAHNICVTRSANVASSRFVTAGWLSP